MFSIAWLAMGSLVTLLLNMRAFRMVMTSVLVSAVLVMLENPQGRSELFAAVDAVVTKQVLGLLSR